MNNIQKFTAALDARLGQLRIDILNDFAASIKEEDKSFFDGVLEIPKPMMGVSLAHDNISGYRVEDKQKSPISEALS